MLHKKRAVVNVSYVNTALFLFRINFFEIIFEKTKLTPTKTQILKNKTEMLQF
jgi:hypothetical protein